MDWREELRRYIKDSRELEAKNPRASNYGWFAVGYSRAIEDFGIGTREEVQEVWEEVVTD